MSGRLRWRPPLAGFHWSEWAAEFAGTALLMAGGLSAIALDFGPGSPVATLVPSVSTRYLLTGAAFGLSAGLVAISPLGRRSGAHLNPAVTFAFWITGHVHPGDVWGYIVAQFTGALAGTALAVAIWGTRLHGAGQGMTLPDPITGEVGAATMEALMTGILVAVILLMVSHPMTMRWTPLAAGLVIAILVWQGAAHTGTGINPARSLAPAIIAGHLQSYWVYLVGPMTGAGLVALVVSVAPHRLRPVTAKLFHHRSDPSVLGTSVPAANRPG